MIRRHNDDDFDERGVLRDRRTARVPMTMRDSLSLGFYPEGSSKPGMSCTINGARGSLQRDENGRLVCVPLRKADSTTFTDGHTTDAMVLHKPGYRVPVVQDRRPVNDAYTAHERALQHSHRLHDGQHLCETCSGAGFDESGEPCEDCDGDGIIDDGLEEIAAAMSTHHESSGMSPRGDSRTVDQIARDHRANMAKLHDSYDQEISQVWRQR